ncbi:rapunzel 5 [Silurus asotus]|uniref:Rapunzel 5 n=1 Tax=Silurus asotus TaxID=30991 RepID=A0AAD5A9V5_SILAS|nr:rapunzel 5 [Silurus asotus]
MASFDESYLIPLEKWFLSNQEEIEAVARFFGETCEILAKDVGNISLLLKYSLLASAKLFKGQNSEQDERLFHHMQQVQQILNQIYDEFDKMERMEMRSFLNIQYFEYEAHLKFQYKMYNKMFTAETNKTQNIAQFITMFENTNGEQNLTDLYDQITGNKLKSNAVRPMLDEILRTEQWSRRAVEKFCAQLKKLFVFGIIALIGYTAIKNGNVREDMVNKWGTRMEEVQNRMKAAVNECVDNFSTHAKKDVEMKLKVCNRQVDSEFAESILNDLVVKYDWVSWSVRVYTDGIKFRNCGLCGILCNMLHRKQCHVSGSEKNYFDFGPCDKNIKILVSFTANPKSLNKDQIKDQIEEEKSDVQSMAESLHRKFSGCLVHTVRRSNKIKEANNFNPDKFYIGSHGTVYIYMHSE